MPTARFDFPPDHRRLKPVEVGRTVKGVYHETTISEASDENSKAK